MSEASQSGHAGQGGSDGNGRGPSQGQAVGERANLRSGHTLAFDRGEAGPRVRTWSRVPEAIGHALRPAHVGLALVGCVLSGLIARLPTLWLAEGTGGPTEQLGREFGAAASGLMAAGLALRPDGIVRAVEAMVVTPGQVLWDWPGSSAAIILPLAIVWGVIGGAIARSTAERIARGRVMPWTAALAFAVRRWVALALMNVIPLGLSAAMVGLLLGLGWAAWSVPWVQAVAGAVLTPVFLVLGGVTLLGLLGWVATNMILVPSLAVEGEDPIDAVQRCFAYLLAAPARMVSMVAMAALLIVGVVAIGRWLIDGVVNLAIGTSMTLAPQAVRSEVFGSANASLEPAGRSVEVLAMGVRFWTDTLGLLAAGVGASLYFTAGTIVYGLMRRHCDGQDPGEIGSDVEGASGGRSAEEEGTGSREEDSM